MGYTLTIGEARLRYSAEDLYLTIEAEDAVNDEAPDHCSFTKKGNSRSPSYTGWSEFCQETGLFELFYGQGWDRELRGNRDCSDGFHRQRPLIDGHPGYAVLCQGDLDVIRQARERREASNGGRPPGFWDQGPETKWEAVDNGKDPALARLLWLEFWVAWALKNCAIPIIENT